MKRLLRIINRVSNLYPMEKENSEYDRYVWDGFLAQGWFLYHWTCIAVGVMVRSRIYLGIRVERKGGPEPIKSFLKFCTHEHFFTSLIFAQCRAEG